MKKVILFAFGLGVMALTSCSKDYECNCTGTVSMDLGDGNTQTEPIDAESFTIESVKEDEAEEECKGFENQVKTTVEMARFGSANANVNCSIREI